MEIDGSFLTVENEDEKNNFKVCRQLYYDNNFCDLTIDVLALDLKTKAGRSIRAHKVILASQSALIRKLLLSKPASVIRISRLSYEVVSDCITFCYGGKIRLNKLNIAEMTRAASYLQIGNLFEKCKRYLILALKTRTCLFHRDIALKFNMNETFNEIEKFIAYNFKEVTCTEEFLRSNLNFVERLLSSNDIQADEMVICNAMMKWIQVDRMRLHFIQNLFLNIRLPVMELEQMVSLTKSVLISSNIIASSFLNQGLQYKLQKEKYNQLRKEEILLKDIHFVARNYIPDALESFKETLNEKMVAMAIGGFTLTGSNNSVHCSTGGPTDSWVPAKEIPERKYLHAAVEIENNVYVIGGKGPDKAYGSVHVYSQKTNTWESLPPLPIEIDGFGLAASNGKIYCTGGAAGNPRVFQKVNFRFDIYTQKWCQKRELLFAKNGHASAALNGYIYNIGAFSQKYVSNMKSCERYDALSNTWQKVAPLCHPRYRAGVAVLFQSIYVSGGMIDDDSNSQTVERYDPVSNVWILLSAQLNFGRLRLAMTSVGEHLIVVGGARADNIYVTEVECFNMKENRWVVLCQDAPNEVKLHALVACPFTESQFRSLKGPNVTEICAASTSEIAKNTVEVETVATTTDTKAQEPSSVGPWEVTGSSNMKDAKAIKNVDTVEVKKAATTTDTKTQEPSVAGNSPLEIIDSNSMNDVKVDSCQSSKNGNMVDGRNEASVSREPEETRTPKSITTKKKKTKSDKEIPCPA